MSESKYLKVLCSIPMILLVLYFFRFWGLIAVVLRYIMYKNKKMFKLPIVLIASGVILVMPKLVFRILKLFKVSLSFLNQFVKLEFYSKLLGYGKYLITTGIIILFIVFIIACILELMGILENVFKEDLEKTKNERPQMHVSTPVRVEPKIIRAREPHIVECPNCGEEVLVEDDYATCKYCRGKVYYKEK